MDKQSFRLRAWGGCMKFTSDYFALIQLLDTELLNQINAASPPILIPEQHAKAVKLGVLLNGIIDDKTSQKTSLMRFMTKLTPLVKGQGRGALGSAINQLFGLSVQQNKVDHLNCLSLMAGESEMVCELQVLKTALAKLIEHNEQIYSEKLGAK